MEESIKGIGKMIKGMGKENKLGRMELHSKECISLIKSVEAANSFTAMEIRMLADSQKAKEKEKVS